LVLRYSRYYIIKISTTQPSPSHPTPDNLKISNFLNKIY
jgi:hypothetical protein